MKIKLNETQYNVYRQFLKEDQESDSQKKAIQFAIDTIGMDKNDAEKYVRETLRMKIQSLNGNRKAGKYTFGVLRLVYKGMNKSLERALNLCIRTISGNEELYKKYDKNLNGLSVQEIYEDVITYVQKKRSSKEGGESKYKIVKINDYQQASTYSDYTSWCICASPARFRQYTDDGTCQFYFALRDGWDKMNSKNHYYEEELLGDYGLSMLAICVEPDGELKSCTCRWNHDKGGNDHCMNVEQIEDVLNLNFYDTFIPSAEGAKKMNSIDKVEEMMENIKTNDDLDEFVRYVTNVRDIEIINYISVGVNIKVFLVNETFKYIFSRTSDGVKLISKTRANTMYGNLYVGSRLVVVFDEEFRIYKLFDKFTGETITKFGKVVNVDTAYLYDDVDESDSILFFIRNETTDFLVDGDGEDTGIMKKLGTTKIYDIMDYQNGYENKTLINILYENKEGKKVTAVFDGFEMIANNCCVIEDYGSNLFVLGNKSKGEKKTYLYDTNYGILSNDNIYHYFEDSDSVVVVKCIKDGKSGEDFGDFYFKLYVDIDGDYIELGTYNGEDFEIVECRDDSDYVILATKEDTKNNLWDIRLLHYGRESVKLENCKMVKIGDSDMQFELGIQCLYKDEEGDYMYIDQQGDIRQWDDFYDNLASDCEDALNDYCERTGKEYDDVDLGEMALSCCTKMNYIKKHLNIHEFM